METNAEALMSIARRYYHDNKYPEAIVYFSKVIELNPNNVDAYICRAIIKGKLKDYQGALSDYNEAIKIYPNDGDTYYNRAQLKNELKDYQGALSDYNEAIKIYPNDVGALYNSAIIKYEILQDYSGAIEDYNKVILIDPLRLKAYINRAVAKSQSENYEGALEDLNKIIEINPNFNLAYLNRGVVNIRLGYYKEGIDDCTKEIAINPNNAFAYINRADAYYMLQKKNEANENCRKSLELGIDIPEICLGAGRFYYRQKQLEKVICCFRITAKLVPDDAGLLYRLGNYYMEWEERKEVEDDFFELFGELGDECRMFYVDEMAFENRVSIAKGFYSRAFIGLLSQMRTDLPIAKEWFTLYYFVGNAAYILDLIEKKGLYFADARNFGDPTDCPLLNEENRSNTMVQVSHQHVRIRCLCDCDGEGGSSIEDSLLMWEEFANGGKGVAYKLKISREWLIENGIYTNKVSYTGKAERIRLLGECESPEQVIESGLFIKLEDFSGQKEWRMVKFGEFEGQDGIVVSFENNGRRGVLIEAVYLGNRLQKELGEKVLNKAKSENIDVYNMIVGKDNLLKSINVYEAKIKN